MEVLGLLRKAVDQLLQTVVMVTHDPVCAVRGDRVIYLRDGRLVDSLELGTWSQTHAMQRHGGLQGWLGNHGF